MAPSEVDILVRKRGYARTKLTKLGNEIDSQLGTLIAEQRTKYLDRLFKLQTELEEHNEAIVNKYLDMDLADDAIVAKQADCAQYDERLLELIGVLKNEVHTPEGNDAPAVGLYARSEEHYARRLDLPKIKLPTFSNGKNESYRKFINQFEAIVNKHRLNSYEKFVYLKGQLDGGPKSLVDSLDSENQLYESATELLSQAFDDETTAKFELIRRFTALNLSVNVDPYTFIGNMRSAVSEAQATGLSACDFMQYFVWHALNPRFQDCLVTITNKNKPSLAEITDHIFEATDRYKKYRPLHDEVCSPPKPNLYKDLQESVSVNAIKVGRKRCALCVSENKLGNHELRYCDVFSTPASKIKKLRALNHCSKCSFSSHDTSKCKYIFESKCRTCNGDHMSFLCLEKTYSKASSDKVNYVSTEAAESEDAEEVIVHNNSSLVELSADEPVTTSMCFSADYRDDVILETFTATLLDSTANPHLVRAFKDNGSQRNFISRNLADKLGCTVVNENVPLNIKGFLSNRKVLTSIVDVPIKINSEIHNVPAICVEKIDTSFKAAALSEIAAAFRQRGYKLADEGLFTSGELVADIGLVLGSESRHILPCTDVVFGNKNRSIFIQTPIGIMLSGNTNVLLENLSHLRDSSSSVNNGSEDLTAYYSSVDFEEAENYIEGRALDAEYLSARHNPTNTEVPDDEMFSNVDFDIARIVEDTATRDEHGRMTVKLPWNEKVSHMLGKNFFLAKQILNTTIKRLQNDSDKLRIYNKVITDQENSGVIERIDDVETFMRTHPNCSFLAHMGIFKPFKESTKCRIVYLSNLCEHTKDGMPAVSHNAALLPGPSLNDKINTSLLFLRFDRYLLIFDICKAFLQIALNEEDSNRLLFLWMDNIESGEPSLVAYRCCRLPFGLRPSPFLLMMVLYKMLVVDTDKDVSEERILKGQVYTNMYMDNGGITANFADKMMWSYEVVKSVFRNYQFDLQQMVTNLPELQNIINQNSEVSGQDETSLLGHTWNTIEDTFSPCKIHLDAEANTTRKCLSSLNSVYDLMGVYCPVLLRARIFIQGLQNTEGFDWDRRFSESKQQEWANVARQANKVPVIEVPRCVGSRSDEYHLYIFTDASNVACGHVLYIKSVERGSWSFCGANNKILNSSLKSKSIPSLELQGILWGLMCMFDIFYRLTRHTVVSPINITKLFLYTDSTCCIHWIEQYSHRFNTLKGKSVFVKNKLEEIDKLCSNHEVTFAHTRGSRNPADVTTRPCSYKTFTNSNFLTGPEVIGGDTEDSACLTGKLVTMPSQRPEATNFDQDVWACHTSPKSNAEVGTLPIKLSNYSNFFRAINVLKYILMFLNKLRNKACGRGLSSISSKDSYRNSALRVAIRSEQKSTYREEINFLTNKVRDKHMPPLVAQMNLFISSDGLLRVKSKFGNLGIGLNPVLLDRNSPLTELIIMKSHHIHSHCGAYQILKYLRAEFYVVGFFSLVRRLLRRCVTCKRFNARTIKLNQSNYRSVRVSPTAIPFANVYMDYAGPFLVKLCGVQIKVWLLIVTCMWSRAINILICRSADTSDFLKALQVHVYEFGIFSSCMSDLGTQLKAGANVIQGFLDDKDTRDFFEVHNIKPLSFSNYPKGNSALGSLVEVCVKQVKLLIKKSIHNFVLDYFEFEHVIEKTKCIINKRPVAFKSNLSNLDSDEVPQSITPEMLIKGYETCTLNIVPHLQTNDLDDDPSDNFEPVEDSARKQYEKLRRVKERLESLYHTEFLRTLISQAVDKKDRYRTIKHDKLSPGDIVLLVEPNTKRSTYPMGRVESVEVNDLNEVTAAYVFKGKTRERVYRHVTSMILLLSCSAPINSVFEDESLTHENLSHPYNLRSLARRN